MHEQDKAILKSLVSVAWADGKISAEESEVLEALLQAFEATAEETAEMRTYAREPRTLGDIPLTELSADDRRLLLQHAVLLTFIDGRRSRKRKAFAARFVRTASHPKGRSGKSLVCRRRAGPALSGSALTQAYATPW